MLYKPLFHTPNIYLVVATSGSQSGGLNADRVDLQPVRVSCHTAVSRTTTTYGTGGHGIFSESPYC